MIGDVPIDGARASTKSRLEANRRRRPADQSWGSFSAPPDPLAAIKGLTE